MEQSGLPFEIAVIK